MLHNETALWDLERSPKLGKRLKAIQQEVLRTQHANQYKIIWDTCCDHGYLGLSLIEPLKSCQLVFVDKATHLTDALEQTLKTANAKNTQVFSHNILEIQLDQKSKHLFILAGIGDELIIEFLKSMIFQQKKGVIGNKLPGFILSPTTGQFELREFLAKQPFQLEHEFLVTEKKRTYDVINVSLTGSKEDIGSVSELGQYWQEGNEQHLNYINKLMQHYQSRMKNDRSGVSETIFYKYSNLLRSLNLPNT